MDLQIYFERSSVQVKERPYLNQQSMEVEIDCIKITQEGEIVTGRHAHSPHLEMKLSRMICEFQRVRVFYTHASNAELQRRAVSNDFNIDFILIFPNYSEILEQISSDVLNKSSEVIVRFHPTVTLNFSQDLYTFIMRCNALNFGYFDDYSEEYDFSQVNEIF